MLMIFRYIFNLIFWTTPTKRTGVSLFGGINSKGNLISVFSIFSKAKYNSVGIMGSLISISDKGISGGGFFTIFNFSKKGEAGGILISLISIAPRGSTYGTFTLFAVDKNKSTEHHMCIMHLKPKH